MSDIITYTGTNQYSYNAHAGNSLINHVSRVICVLLPREVIIAGFNGPGDLLMVRHYDYGKNNPIWGLDFFEKHFINEPLLAKHDLVKTIFIGCNKYIVVPDELYNQQKAEDWLKKICFVASDDVTSVYHLHKDQANYVYAWETALKSLISRYFSQAKVLPFAGYQFYKPYKSEYSLLCCITNTEVYATLYNNRV